MAALRLFPEAFAADVCAAAIRRFRALELEPGIAGGRHNPRIRCSRVAWPDAADPLCRRAERLAREANEADWRLALCARPPGWQFTEYRALDAGTYHEHMDCALDDRDRGRALTRKLSVVVQLSDPADYRGGTLRFGAHVGAAEPGALRARGSVAVFPSFVPHGVSELLYGARYSLVGWFSGPHWR